MAYVRTSVLDGLSVLDLQARLTAMQLALLDMQAGKFVSRVSYTQGEGGRTVEFAVTSIADLTQAILSLQSQIDRLNGVAGPARRRPIFPVFGGR